MDEQLTCLDTRGEFRIQEEDPVERKNMRHDVVGEGSQPARVGKVRDPGCFEVRAGQLRALGEPASVTDHFDLFTDLTITPCDSYWYHGAHGAQYQGPRDRTARR